nr:ATP-binding protein [uncultured Anaerosporobacter sp.]
MTERPYIPQRNHPIYTGDYYIQTNSIDNLFKEVTNWIDCRNPGGIIYGRARIGKTRAIHNLSIAIKEEYGDNISIFNVLMSEHKPSEKFFYLEMLNDIGHSLALSYRSTSDLKSNLVNHLIAVGKSNKMGQIILFIDEANFMSMDDFNYLIDIYNRLERSKVRMTVLLVGTKEVISTKTALMQMNKQQIIERFMVREYNFRGIISRQDLQICLASYDYSEYPENSGWSFTRYFFPEAFSEGNKLCKYADLLLDCFSESLGTSSIEIPMQYVTSTIENCLRKYGADGQNVYFPSKVEWMQSIKDTGYVIAENLFVNYKAM